ncbi:MAG TPA: UDP-2,3-diacylglucosamine diphosphatase, partial [Thiolapillus brandeum]|nr:UDP-2,3-diacylglucosamine diphosphatase [Thiolapillus brandeum]
MRDEILFISDLHLDRNQPEISRHFLHFLKTRAAHARVLYILGDLFEIWLGDDDPAEAFTDCFDA